MNGKQQYDYIAFVANFVKLLHEEGITYQQAELIMQMAASALLGAVLQVKPTEFNETFAVSIIHTALKKFYGDRHELN